MAVAFKILRVNQGDSFFIKIPLVRDGVPASIQGWSFWFTVKAEIVDPDAAAVISKSTTEGTILPIDQTSVYVVGAPADTKNRDLGRYLYDIQAKSPAGDIFTLERGYFDIAPEITQAV